MTYLSRRGFGLSALLAGAAASLSAPQAASAQPAQSPADPAATGGVGAIVVELAVGGRTARFVLDSAQRRSWINPESAAALGLAGTGETIPPSPDLNVEVAGVRAALVIGESNVELPLVAVQTLTGLTDLSQGIDGILGSSTLALFERVEFGGDALTLQPQGTSQQQAVRYPIEQVDGRGIVVLEVAGADGRTRSLRFLLHTGCPFTFLLQAHARALGLPAIDDGAGHPIAGTLHAPGHPALPVVAGTVAGLGEVHFAVHSAPMAMAEGIDGTLGTDALNTPTGNLFQTIADWATLSTGKGLSIIVIAIIGLGALLGQVSWGMVMIVSIGISLVFGAAGIVNAFGFPPPQPPGRPMGATPVVP